MFWLPPELTPGKTIAADPSKFTPPIVRGVVRVAADPDVFWLPPELTPGKTIAADPSKSTPPIDLGVVRVAAEPAEPVVFWFRVGIRAASRVPDAILVAFSAVSPEPLPANVVAVTVPTTSRAVVGAVVLPMEMLCAE